MSSKSIAEKKKWQRNAESRICKCPQGTTGHPGVHQEIDILAKHSKPDDRLGDRDRLHLKIQECMQCCLLQFSSLTTI